MEAINAKVEVVGDKHFISIDADGDDVRIPMSEDRPTDVKLAFNKLIKLVKDSPFQIQLTDVGGDLFSQVANEYVKQLNREIQEVYGEMVKFGLVDESEEETE